MQHPRIQQCGIITSRNLLISLPHLPVILPDRSVSVIRGRLKSFFGNHFLQILQNRYHSQLQLGSRHLVDELTNFGNRFKVKTQFVEVFLFPIHSLQENSRPTLITDITCCCVTLQQETSARSLSACFWTMQRSRKKQRSRSRRLWSAQQRTRCITSALTKIVFLPNITSSFVDAQRTQYSSQKTARHKESCLFQPTTPFPFWVDMCRSLKVPIFPK